MKILSNISEAAGLASASLLQKTFLAGISPNRGIVIAVCAGTVVLLVSFVIWAANKEAKTWTRCSRCRSRIPPGKERFMGIARVPFCNSCFPAAQKETLDWIQKSFRQH